MNRTISNPRVRPEHPRRPEPSFIQLSVVLPDLKGAPVALGRITEDEAIELAQQCLTAVVIIRRNR